MKKSMAARLAVLAGAFALCVHPVSVIAGSFSQEHIFDTVKIVAPDYIRDAIPKEEGYTIVKLNFRDSPSLEGKILCTLEPNEKVRVLGREKNHWVKTDRGYCYGPYLASEAVDLTIRASFEGEGTSDYKGVFYKELAWLPEEYLDYIRNFRYVITNENLENYYDGPDVGEIAGLTTAELPDGDHVIYLKREEIGDSLLHEMWHAIEINKQYHSGAAEELPYSQTIKYQELYEKYKEEYLEDYNFDYAAGSSKEFWAQMFLNYIKNKKYLEKKMPELYQDIIQEKIFEIS